MKTVVAIGDLNKVTFAGVLRENAIAFQTAELKTPGCSFVLQVKEDPNGPVNEIPCVVHGTMAVNIYPKLTKGQRVLVQASARFKTPGSKPKPSDSPFFVVREIVTIPHVTSL